MKILEKIEENYSWQELLEGYPACIGCDEKVMERVEDY